MDKLIVQLKVGKDTDFDQLIGIEEALIQKFMGNRTVEVDGHDFGEGRFNIYIHLSKGWEPALATITAALDGFGLLSVAVVAKFHGETEQYEVVRPDSYSGPFTL
ncbi:MAG: hypothetical protein JWR07_4665 [Nevskia sp.]|nr:hypothetical protein [Nevskia sp.]